MNNLMKRIMSVAMAAITTTSPILSSYTIYASDITVSDDGTITQMSTSTDSSMSEADETKFLFIKLKTAGGKVVLNEGEDQEQRIRLDKKMDGAEYIDVYDKNDVLISSESTKDNGYTYVYEAKADDAVNVKAKADEGYTVKLYELTDDSSGTEIAEDVGFDAGNKVEAFKYPVFMEYDKTVKIGFEKKESAEDIAEDLSVNDEAVKEKSAKAEETAGQLEETEEEVDAIKAEDLEAEHVKADDEGAEAEMNGDTESEDTKNAEDAGISKKSENTKDIGSNDKQDVSEEAAKGDDLAVNADGNKEDNEDANITVNDNDINKNIDENTEEESEEKSGEDIMGNDGVSEDTKDAGSDNPDETADTTSEGAKVVESPAPDEISSNTDEDSITNDAKTECLETIGTREGGTDMENTALNQQGESVDEISSITLRYISSVRFVIPTKSILELERKIYTWLKIGTTGACIWGRARIGKSYSVQYIAKSIQQKLGENFPVVIWNITDHPATERNFYASLLMAMGLACPKRDTALFLKERVLNELIIRASDTPYREVVIFIDEAWKLGEPDFSWLMDLYNNLKCKDIHIISFLFGTRELKNLKNELKIRGKDQIVGRFMVCEEQFFGICTKQELSFCLTAFDKLHVRTLNFSETDKMVREFYFPHADGRTFYDLTDEYWEAFQKTRAAHNILATDIPMKYFIDSFIICLDMYGALSFDPVCFPGIGELMESIKLSGYGESDDEYERRKRK